MSKRTYLPLLMDRWTAGTQELTFEERGFYICLLVWMYDTGEAVKDSDHAARILRCDKRTSRRLLGKLRPKFRPTSAGLRHKVLDNLIRNGGRIKGLEINSFPTDPDPDPDPEKEKITPPIIPPLEQKPRQKRGNSYPQAFEAVWDSRPKRAGGDDKRRAHRGWAARVDEGHDPETIQAGVDRYRAYCEKTGKLGTEYVKQLATFLGPADPPHFTQDWVAPINGGNGNNGRPKTYDDYTRNLRAQMDTGPESAECPDEGWVDTGASAEVLGDDGSVVRTAVVQRARTKP